MRRLLLALPTAVLACLLLAGCGDEDAVPDPTTASAGRTVGTPRPSPEPAPPEFSVTLVSGADAGGTTSTLLSPVDGAAQLDDFTAQFTSPRFAQDIVDAADAAWPGIDPGGELLVGVVAVGCDVPPGVDVTETPEGYQALARKVTTPPLQCLVPVTTVAVVAVVTG